MVAHSSGIAYRWLASGIVRWKPVSKAATSGRRGNRSREHPHRLDVGRIVRGGDVGERLHRLEHVLVDELDAGQVAGVDRLEADRRDVGGVLEHADLGVGQLVEADLHGVAVVGDRLDQLDLAAGRADRDLGVRRADPLDRAARQQRLGRVARGRRGGT